MLAGEISAYLATTGLGLVEGTNLFDKPLPMMATDPAVCVIATGGGAPADRTFGPSLTAPLGVHPDFVVVVRGVRDGSEAAELLAQQVHKKLDNLGPVTLSGVLYRDVRAAAGEPGFVAFDKNKRPHFSCTYVTDKDPS